MAITTPAEPALAQQALRGALQPLLARPSDPTAARLEAAGLAIDRLHSAAPYQIYGVALDALSAGSFLDSASPGAWKYLIAHPAALAPGAEGGSPSIAMGAEDIRCDQA